MRTSIMEELRPSSFTDADFNARAPQPPERVPTYRDYRFHNTTWFVIGFLVSFTWINIAGEFVLPFGLIVATAMGLLLRDHARGAAHPFEFPLFILVAGVGAVVGAVLEFNQILF